MVLEYIKKQKILIVFCAVFLVLQAMFSLALPYITGDMINIGVQQKGIESLVPTGFSPDGMALMCYVLPEKEEKEFMSFYTLDKAGNYILSSDDDSVERAKELYQNGITSAVYIALAELEKSDGNLSSGKINFVMSVGSVDRIYDLLMNMPEYPQKEIERHYEESKEISGAVKTYFASVVTPYFCEDIGIDCDALQKEYIKEKAILMAVCALMQIAFLVVCIKLARGIAMRVTENMRRDYIIHTSGISLKRRRACELDFHTVFATDIGNVSSIIEYAFCFFLYAPIVSLGSLILSFNISVSLSMIVLVTIIIIIVMLAVLTKLAIPVYERMQMFYGKLVGVLRKNISQLYTVRTMQTEEVERYKFFGAADNVRKNERFILRAVFTGLAVVSLISNIVIAVAVIPMGDQLLSSSIGMGDFIAFLQYSAITVSAFTTIGAVIIFAPRAKVSFNNFKAVMEIPEETDDEDSVDLDIKPHKIEFCDVTLESGNAKQLKNVNITFEAGSITAITGPTGCGKTCLLQTLIGNGKKESGEILLDSHPLERIKQASIRRAVSYGFSDPILFTSSVRENLSMYGVDEGNMDTALKMACVDFIDDTNARLDNAGGRLSGGQRARVALAGVLGKDAEIYIIDDCLRSLDKKTEETAIDNLRVLSEKATVILVSQRIRTLMLADKTIVIDEDGTVTEGNHEELMKCSEFYKELSNLQKWEVSADE